MTVPDREAWELSGHARCSRCGRKFDIPAGHGTYLRGSPPFEEDDVTRAVDRLRSLLGAVMGRERCWGPESERTRDRRRAAGSRRPS